MRLAIIFRVVGTLLMLFSATMLPPMAVSLLYQDGQLQPFLTGFAIILALGIACWYPTRSVHKELRTRDGFFITVLIWTVLCLAGAVPLYLSDQPSLPLADAVFESVSGLTTTGATVITGIDHLPHSILWYRQQLHWLGGMGIIVLAVAVLPMLGIGGMQLYRAEAPGPVKDNKLKPRITETAKALWYIYLGLTVVCTLAYWAAGMSLFDAIGHAFSTVSTGGFSTHDASIGYFNSPAIDLITIVFMLLGAIGFALHFMVIHQRNPRIYWHDPELKFYLAIIGAIVLLAVTILIGTGHYDVPTALLNGLFEVVSIATSTGYMKADFSTWPLFLPFLLFVVAFMGGCVGSTAGGMKVMRILLIFKQGLREVHRLIHPNAVVPVKLGRRLVPDRVLEAVWGFFSIYMFMFVVLLLILLGTGLDQVTAWTAVAACINNLGPGLGDVTYHFGSLSETAKWVLSFAMLLGRLEVFTVLILLTPEFWRR